MELFRQMDGYCERVGPEFWAEPINALTNLAFLVAAVAMWRRAEGLAMGRALSGLLFAIGLGSWLFHTHAQVWAAIADVAPIAGFILIYIYGINRHGWGLRPLWAGILTLVFFPFAALTVPLWQNVPIYGNSAGYMPVPMLILIYAALFSRRAPILSRGLFIGAGILLVSLTARGLDEPLCNQVPLGTHFLWHVLNAIMLAWMIETYLRHRRSGQST